MLLIDDDRIEMLALSVIDRSLPKKEWTHEAHFALALWLFRHHPDLTAPDQIRKLITGYNEATNTPNTDDSGYHQRHHLGRCRSDLPINKVLISLMLTCYGNSNWLLLHWERDTLFSVAARKAWVEPDRAQLPFD
jgi:hypothetical protein